MRTTACDTLQITHPVVMAGMGGATSPELVAAVSEAGGLGILACTWSTPQAARDDIRQIRKLTSRPFGVNFVLHLTDDAVLQSCLAEAVPVFSFFRGDPAPATKLAHQAGAIVMHQITTPAEAEVACAAGVDILVAQGCEAGGHMGALPLSTLLPEVVRIAGRRPTLGAGGIVDGHDLAAALCRGAAGVVMGTRFLATLEAPVWAEHKQAILDARAGDTIATLVWDHLWTGPWPGGIRVRSLRNRTTDLWHGNEAALLKVLAAARSDQTAAEARHDVAVAPTLAGEGASRIRSLLAAAEVVRSVVAEAEAVLAKLSGLPRA